MKPSGTTIIGTNAQRLGIATLRPGQHFYEEDTGEEWIVNEGGDDWIEFIPPNLPDHDHTGDAGDGNQISHDTALTGVSADDHHNEVHTVSSTGPHAEDGLTIGHLLRATGAAAFAWAEAQLADLASYVRGSIMRGGATDWEQYDAKTNHFILVGDGTDIASKAFDWDDMAAGAAADMVHDHSSAAEGSAIPATSVEIAEIGTATYDDVQDWLNIIQSAGYFDGGTITAHSDAITAANAGGAGAGSFEVADDQTAGYPAAAVFTVSGSTGNDGDYTVKAGGSSHAGGTTTIPVDEAVPDGTADGDIANGRVDCAAIYGFLKITDDEIASTKPYDLAVTANLEMTDVSCNYVYIDFVSGPRWQVTVTRSDVEWNRQHTVGRVYRNGTDIHIIQSGIQLANFLREVHERSIAVEGFVRAEGGTVAESGDRNLASEAGVFYLGRNKATTTGVDTADGGVTFTRWYHVAGDWASDQKSQICAAAYQYDDGTDLANFTLYGVFWVFIHFDGDIHVVVGRGNYTLANAQSATVPGLPDAVSCFGTLAAKVIVKFNGTNFTSIESAYTTAFATGGAFDHNDTTNKQGGTAGEYYHLEAAEHTELNAWLDNIILGNEGSIGDVAGLQFKDATELTIAAGVVTATQVFHIIDTAGDAADDELDTINGGASGDIIIIRAAHTDRTVTLKHNTGNLLLRGAADIGMDDATTLYYLMYDGGDSKWHDLGGGGGGGGASAWLDLTDTPAAFEASKFPVVNAAGDALEFTDGAACAFETTTVEVAGWEELDRDTLTGSQASFDFTSISQDYEDLKIVCRLRTDKVATIDDVVIALNNDAVNANYYTNRVLARNAAISTFEADARIVGNVPAGNGLAGSFHSGEITMRRYATAENHILYSWFNARNAATEQYQSWSSVHWETAAAITRVTLTPAAGDDFDTGSEVVLYGLRKRDVVTAVTGQVVVTGDTVAKVATVTGIDATAVAATTLYAVPAGKTFIPDHVVIRVTAFTDGGKAVQAMASFGGNAATYDDYLNSITYTIAAADVFIRDSVEDTAVVTQAAADVFKVSIETASDATVETWAVDLFGYLV